MGQISNIPLEVEVSREPWMPWFIITLSTGKSEELEPDQTREWFRLRNANMIVIESCLDDVWNFCDKRVVIIENPRILNKVLDDLDPKI